MKSGKVFLTEEGKDNDDEGEDKKLILHELTRREIKFSTLRVTQDTFLSKKSDRMQFLHSTFRAVEKSSGKTISMLFKKQLMIIEKETRDLGPAFLRTAAFAIRHLCLEGYDVWTLLDDNSKILSARNMSELIEVVSSLVESG